MSDGGNLKSTGRNASLIEGQWTKCLQQPYTKQCLEEQELQEWDTASNHIIKQQDDVNFKAL